MPGRAGAPRQVLESLFGKKHQRDGAGCATGKSHPDLGPAVPQRRTHAVLSLLCSRCCIESDSPLPPRPGTGPGASRRAGCLRAAGRTSVSAQGPIPGAGAAWCVLARVPCIFLFITVPRATVRQVFLVIPTTAAAVTSEPRRGSSSPVSHRVLGPRSLLAQRTPAVRPHPARTRENYGRSLK